MRRLHKKTRARMAVSSEAVGTKISQGHKRGKRVDTVVAGIFRFRSCLDIPLWGLRLISKRPLIGLGARLLSYSD